MPPIANIPVSTTVRRKIPKIPFLVLDDFFGIALQIGILSPWEFAGQGPEAARFPGSN
jgi:hypothetical protein